MVTATLTIAVGCSVAQKITASMVAVLKILAIASAVPLSSVVRRGVALEIPVAT